MLRGTARTEARSLAHQWLARVGLTGFEERYPHQLEEAIALSDRVLLLSAGPRSRLKGDYAVDLPRPRNVVEARFTPGFSEIYERVWSGLREEVMATYAKRQ